MHSRFPPWHLIECQLTSKQLQSSPREECQLEEINQVGDVHLGDDGDAGMCRRWDLPLMIGIWITIQGSSEMT